ncbi:FH protein interacting protein FIP2 [Tanacetum coccineum]
MTMAFLFCCIMLWGMATGLILAVSWELLESRHGQAYCFEYMLSQWIYYSDVNIKGDYYKYLAEFKSRNDKKEVADQSLRSYQDLSYVDFSFACLKNVFFSRANLHCAKFRGRCEFSGANLRGVLLAGANLQSANLQGKNACLIDCSFCGADLRSAHLQTFDLTNTNLEGANLEGANLKVTSVRGTVLWRLDQSERDKWHWRVSVRGVRVSVLEWAIEVGDTLMDDDSTYFFLPMIEATEDL